MKARAVFCDRDGTLIRDVGYPRDPDAIELMPGAVSTLAALRQRGFLLVVISNQSGIGRGLVTRDEADRVDDRFQSLLAQHGIALDGAYYCPHAPSDACHCRKPATGLLERAAEELRIDLSQSWMIGDKESDVEAGRRAGCRAARIHPESRAAWDQALQQILSLHD